MGDVVDGQRLRAMREVKGWDQRTLARRAGVDPSVISRLERGVQGDVRASVLVALARTLATPVDSLLSASGEETHPELVRELDAALRALAGISPDHQRQVAAMLRGYLAHPPE